MQFLPYSHKNAVAVMKMLADHFDYTPETDSEENMQSNIDYFKEVYVEEGGHGICYVLKANDDDSVIGFLSATKHDIPNGAACWYITSLFVQSNEHANENALYMVDAFFDSIHDSNEICANVHPAATQVISFWMKNGFVANPDRSIFSNTSDERLTAYWKTR